MKRYLFGTIFILVVFMFSDVFAETATTTAAPVTSTSEGIDIEAQVIGLVGGPNGFMEKFRQKQSVYFAALRDQTKEKIGIKDTSGINETPQAPLPFTDAEKMGDLPEYKQDSPWDYAILIASTAMATVFSEVLLFYIALIILTFFVIRFLFRMFI